MNIKKILLAALSVGGLITLSSCGSGAESPTNNQNYGDVVSLSKQQLNSIPAGFMDLPVPLPYYKFGSLGVITSAAGDYLDLQRTDVDGLTPITIQNNIATSDNYNYMPIGMALAALTSPSEFPSLAESVSAYSVEYKTPGQNASTDPAQIVRTASGLIITPNMKQGQKIKGVVVYFHPTTVGKNQVPSCLGAPVAGLPTISKNIPEYCNITTIDNTGAATFASLAFIYAANGYVVVAPDYVGQGSDAYNVHPYVAYPEVNVLSAVNMLPATRQILSTDYGISESQVLPLFVTGYSEGGGYALKASQMIQSDSNFTTKYGLSLKMTSPQEGAYSLKDQMDFAFAEAYDGVFNCPTESCGQINLAIESQYLESVNPWNVGSAYYAAQTKPYLVSYVLTAVNYYKFNNLSSAYDFTMKHKFWADVPVESVIANLYELYSAQLGYVFTGGEIIGSIVGNAIGLNNYDYLAKPKMNLYIGNTPLPLTLASTTPNGVPFGNNNNGNRFMNQGIQTNPDFEQVVNQGTTYNWKTNSPINFIHLRNDSAVTPLNSKQAISCMKYGKNFTGDNSLAQPSAGGCSVVPSGNLIGDTEIPNYQITNSLAQMTPGDDAAISQFFVNPSKASNPAGYVYVQTMNNIESTVLRSDDVTGTPFDHGDMFVLGNIIALCNFENMLESDTISSFCPSKYNPD